MCTFNASAQNVYTVGGGVGQYSTLKQAFDAINAGQITGEIVLQIAGNTTETSTATLNRSGSGAASYSSVLVYPLLTGLSISGNLNGTLISLNGASNVVIDGRADTTGTTASLTISNASNGSSSSNIAISLLNSASNNAIRFCQLLSSGTSTSAAVISFGTSNSGTGNNSNVVEHCIFKGYNSEPPPNIIYSAGTSGRENRYNTIRNNHFEDYFKPLVSSNGIYIASHSHSWEIVGNHFFLTSTLAPSGSNRVYYSIRIAYANINNNFVIEGNWIGGSAPFCAGSPQEMSAGANFRYYVIHCALGVNASNIIRQNTIQNMEITSSHANHFYGITVSSGNAMIGENIIGSPLGNDHIMLTNTASHSTTYGFHLATAGEILMQGNTVGGVTANGSTSISHTFYGIFGSVSGNLVLEGNLVGSLQTMRSIQSASSSTSSTAQSTIGIQIAVTGSLSITGNTVMRLFNAYARSSSTTGQVAGIVVTGAGAASINGNTIRDLSNTAANTGSTNAAAVIGIAARHTGADKEVSDNVISHLRSLHPTAAVHVMGLFYEGGLTGSNRIERNYIHSLGLESSSVTASINGIRIISGDKVCCNNLISLGADENRGCLIYGIYETGSATHNSYLYHNTVVVSGSRTGSAHTFALFSNATTNLRDIRNNLLVNERTTFTGTGRNYSLRIGGTANLTISRNNYYVSGNNGSVGMNNTTTLNTLIDWQGSVVQDQGSIGVDPVWAATGNMVSEQLTPTVALTGEFLSVVLKDFDHTLRPDPPTMGAVEYLHAWTGITSNDWSLNTNWTSGTLPVPGQSIVIPAGCNYYPILAQTVEVGKLRIRNGGVFTIGSQGALTVHGQLSNQAGISGLIVESSEFSQGSLIHQTSGVWGSFKVTLPGDTLTWHMISAPVSDMTITGSSFEPGVDDEFYLWHEPSPGTWVNYKNQDGSGGYPSFPFANNGGNLFLTGRGYIVAYNLVNPVKTFQGTFHAGEITFPLQASSSKSWKWEAGWNLIGNPYPSSLDWNLVDKQHLAEVHAQVYDPAFGTGGGYRTVTTIAPNQGFFVKAVSPPGSIIPSDPVIVLDQTMQTHGATLFKTHQNLFANKLSLRILQGQYFDEAQFLIADGSSMDYDFLDATKLFSYHPDVPQLFSRSIEERWLSINTFPEIPLKTSIPLSITASKTGVTTLAIHEITGTFSTAQVYLHDHLLDSVVLLSQDRVYAFDAAPGIYHDRFSISFGNINISDEALFEAYTYLNMLMINNIAPKADLRVFSIDGKQVLNHQLGPGSYAITTNLAQGVYIVRLMANEETLSKKVFISGR